MIGAEMTSAKIIGFRQGLSAERNAPTLGGV
jgi:hypothetical protein